MTAFKPPQRRRVYLMRHGDVVYYDANGQRVADPDGVTLTEKGRRQATAAGEYLANLGVKTLDLIVTSNLRRTIETADGVLAGGGITGRRLEVPALREIKSGDFAAIPTGDLERVYLRLKAPRVAPDARYLNGESIAEVQARVFPALDAILADTWDTALLVLHGVVNKAIVSHALTGGTDYLGRLEAGAGCLHILDVGASFGDCLLRAYNVCPEPATYYPTTRLSGHEQQLLQALRGRA